MVPLIPCPDGLLLVDKPGGLTSHTVVTRVRRALGSAKAGHTGTLDPLATGVLAVLLGRATRLAQFLSTERKRYLATVRFGFATSTYDREGEPAGEPVDVGHIDRAMIAAALAPLRGTFPQVPPPFSAKKIGGVSAHRLARRGREVVTTPVNVTVFELELMEVAEGRVTLDIACSAGFYVRSLAHELGVALGCGAHLHALRRTAAGAFTLDDAVPLAALEADPVAASKAMRPMAALLPDLAAVQVTPSGLAKVRHGRPLGLEDCLGGGVELADTTVPASETDVRLLDDVGVLVAIARWTGGGKAGGGISPALHPRVVLV